MKFKNGKEKRKKMADSKKKIEKEKERVAVFSSSSKTFEVSFFLTPMKKKNIIKIIIKIIIKNEK